MNSCRVGGRFWSSHVRTTEARNGACESSCAKIRHVVLGCPRFFREVGAVTHTIPNWISTFRAVAPSGGLRWLQRRGPEVGGAVLATRLTIAQSNLETSGFNKDKSAYVAPLSTTFLAFCLLKHGSQQERRCPPHASSVHGSISTVDFLCHAVKDLQRLPGSAWVAGPLVPGAGKCVIIDWLAVALHAARWRCLVGLRDKLGATLWSQEPPK